MAEATKLAFISPTNDRGILTRNLLSSPIFREKRYPLILQEGFRNISKAYNQAMVKTDADVLVFLHQDVFLPDNWDSYLLRAISSLDTVNWGVLGVAGVRLVNGEVVIIGHLLDRGTELGLAGEPPAIVDTLDEVLLVLRKGVGLRFDEKIPTAHYYGADICLQARKKGLVCLAIDAYCHHNSSLDSAHLPPEFYIAREYMRRKWRNKLPFATTAGIVSHDVKPSLTQQVFIRLVDITPKGLRKVLRPIYALIRRSSRKN